MRIPWTEVRTRPAVHHGSAMQSRYLTMRDGVRIAVDVTLPDPLPRRGTLPAIIRQTRYHRRFNYQPPFDAPALRKLFDRQYEARKYFVSRGYAWVDVCARGSGASGGTRPVPWSPDEVEDGREIVDWIVAQPWSNGRVGARGVSYDGTSAEWMLVHQHPAIRAVAPRFSLFDAFEDIAMPGGIHLEQFTRNWAAFNSALDRNRIDEVLTLVMTLSKGGQEQLARSFYVMEEDSMVASALMLAPLTRLVISRFVPGVAMVDEDTTGEVLRDHLERRPPALDVHEAGSNMTYRDDGGFSTERPELDINTFSPHAHLDRLRGTGVPVYHYTGWFDGAYQRAAIRRFLAHDDRSHRLIIGPWEHGGQQDISPWEASREPLFDHEAELLRFFDAHLVGDRSLTDAWEAEPRVRYFTMGAERWRTSDTWPPPGVSNRRWFLGTDARLTQTEPRAGSEVRLFVRGRHGSGLASRWRCLLPTMAHTHYLSRDGDDIVTFVSDPLPSDLEVTGSPVLHVELTSSTDDPRLFAYLEDVERAGLAHYVTEGQLRAIHRRVAPNKPAWHGAVPYRTYRRDDHQDAPRGTKLTFEFDLLPTSYLFRRGHSLRLVLAGADADHFDVGPSGAHRIDLSGSWVDLPIRG